MQQVAEFFLHNRLSYYDILFIAAAASVSYEGAYIIGVMAVITGAISSVILRKLFDVK